MDTPSQKYHLYDSRIFGFFSHLIFLIIDAIVYERY